MSPQLPANRLAVCRDWLPPGKQGAVCFGVDDVHPATSQDEYEAGGDLGRGALGRIERLLERQPRLRVTLFVTPDWRMRHLVATRKWLTSFPWVRDRVHWAPIRRKGHFRVDRFPAFVAHLNGMRRTDIAVHGLSHIHRGPQMAVEFQQQNRRQCNELLRAATGIFDAAGLRHVPGFQAPAWNAPPALCEALGDSGFHFLCSARDLRTPVSPGARTAMSGLSGAPLIQPGWIAPSVVHITTNFQATSSLERAFEILDAGGLVSIKAHIFKTGGGITMVDGLDEGYADYLDLLCRELERRYGESLWWTTLAEVADRCRMMPR